MGAGPNAAGNRSVLGKAKSFMSGIFGASNPFPEGFNGLPVSAAGNGDFFVQGNHHEAFMECWNNSENYEYESLDNPICETIDPANIEGIRTGTSEEAFWEMHASSKENWESYASKAKKAQEMYEAGIPLDSILDDPDIGDVAGVHFQGGGQGHPAVVRNEDGFYEFDGNGRHRIIVARRGGYKIPVRVVGVRKRK